jgi:hypothetical protein
MRGIPFRLTGHDGEPSHAADEERPIIPLRRRDLEDHQHVGLERLQEGDVLLEGTSIAVGANVPAASENTARRAQAAHIPRIKVFRPNGRHRIRTCDLYGVNVAL